jgi:hypothetical protein
VSTDSALNKPTRGGERKRAGRPSQGLTERIELRLTPEGKAKLERLGGSTWVREQLRRVD